MARVLTYLTDYALFICVIRAERRSGFTMLKAFQSMLCISLYIRQHRIGPQRPLRQNGPRRRKTSPAKDFLLPLAVTLTTSSALNEVIRRSFVRSSYRPCILAKKSNPLPLQITSIDSFSFCASPACLTQLAPDRVKVTPLLPENFFPAREIASCFFFLFLRVCRAVGRPGDVTAGWPFTTRTATQKLGRP